MTGEAVAAFATALGVVGAAAVSGVGVILGLLWRRITTLETHVAKVEQRERAVWWWARSLQDYYYRYRRDGAPDLPPPPTLEGEPHE